VAAIFGLPLLVMAYVSPGSPTGHVNDFANILSDDAERVLNSELEQFRTDTSNEIAVVTISSLDGDTIENYAVQLFEEWKIGKADKDNGVLILVAPNEREVRIEVGYGLEGALTDAQSYWIIQEKILPAFREGDYMSGIQGGIGEIIKATRGEYVPAAEDGNFQIPIGLDNLFDWVWVVFFIPVWLASVLARSKSWWAGGIIGGLIGVVLGVFFEFFYFGLIASALLIPLGLILDYVVSSGYSKAQKTGHYPWWIGGRGGSGGSSWGGGGGFGGFGGGGSGGGGASGRW